MAQARKNKNKSSSRPAASGNGTLMLLIGILIGSLGTVLWQGMRSDDEGVGSGIRKMIEQSRQQELQVTPEQPADQNQQPVQQQTNFDFYTVLPEIEVVVPRNAPEEPVKTVEQENQAGSEEAGEVPVSETSAYMLQAGSYQNQGDADRLRAELALMGLSSGIQKVTIEGRGDFYRVRLGPYNTHEKMVSADQQLASHGIKALRLKISKGG